MGKLFLYKCPANFNKGFSRVEIIEMVGNNRFTYKSVTQSGKERIVTRTLAKKFHNDSEFFLTEEEARKDIERRMYVSIIKQETKLSRLKRKYEIFKDGGTT